VQNIIFAFSAIAPLFIQIALGFFLKRKKVVDQQFIDTSSDFVYHYLFPLVLFRQTYQIDITSNVNPLFIGYGVVICILFGLLLFLIVPRFINDRGVCGAFIQGSYRSNSVFMGIPLALNVFGEAGSLPTIMLLPFAAVTFNIFSLVVLTVLSPEREKVGFRNLLSEIVKNPIVKGTVCGIAVSLLGIKLPVFLTDVVGELASIATPLALISLGGQLEFKSLLEKPGLIFSGSFIKLVVSPLLAIIPAMLLFDFSAFEMGALYVIFGSSTAVSSFVMAKVMKSDDSLAGQMVVYTTIFSSVTMFLWIYVLKSFQII
jgi:predicted permease